MSSAVRINHFVAAVVSRGSPFSCNASDAAWKLIEGEIQTQEFQSETFSGSLTAASYGNFTRRATGVPTQGQVVAKLREALQEKGLPLDTTAATKWLMRTADDIISETSSVYGNKVLDMVTGGMVPGS